RWREGRGRPVRLAPAGRWFHREARVDYRLLPLFPQRGIGTPICYGGFDWAVSGALWFGPVAQQRIEPAGAGNVELLRWSPSELRLRAVLRGPDTLVFDQTFAAAWS